MNVDQFTGTANVTIPIYDYQIDGLNLGISANYNTKGLRVDQIAGEIGLGWNLDAGGSITRSVHGIEDDQKFPALGYHVPYGAGAGYDVTKYVKPYRGVLANCGGTTCEVDQEFDVYDANFCGQSIKFTLQGHGGTGWRSIVSTANKRRLVMKLVWIDSAGNATAYLYANTPDDNGQKFRHESKHSVSIGFVLADDLGNTFHFKRGDYREREYSVEGITPNAGSSPGDVYSYKYYPTERWVLYKVETRSGAVVNYRYRSIDNVEYSTGREELVKEYQFEMPPGAFESTRYPSQTAGLHIVADSIVKWRGGVKQLTQIEYPNGTIVKFQGGLTPGNTRCDIPSLTAIDSIVVVSGYAPLDSNRLTYRFNYRYRLSYGDGREVNSNLWTNPSSITTASYASSCWNIYAAYPGWSLYAKSFLDRYIRLELGSIDILDKTRSKSERYYTFTYNPDVLPNIGSISQDHYGFYNGKVVGSSNYNYSGSASGDDQDVLRYSSIPRHAFFRDGHTVTYGADKMSDSSFAMASNLTAIENGMKGRIELFYKPHVLTNLTNGYLMDGYVTGSTFYSYPMPTDMECRNVNDGLCIDRIVYTDGYQRDNTYSDKYTYTDGVRFFQGGYYWYPTMVESPTTSGPSTIIWNRMYRNSNVQPQEPVNGANHGYTNVWVTRRNFLGTILQNFSSTFSNLIDPNNESLLRMTSGAPANTLAPRAFFKNRIGKVLKTESYDHNGILTEKDEYQYTLPPLNGNNALSTIVQTWFWRYTYTGALYKQTPSIIYSPFISHGWLMSLHTKTSFAGSNSASLTKTFAYDGHDNLLQTQWHDSKGALMSLMNRYSYASGWPENLVGLLLAKDLWKQENGQKALLNRVENKYASQGDLKSLLVSEWGLKLDYPIPESSINADPVLFLQNHNRETMRIGLRDPNNNVVEHYENIHDTVASIWDTRIGQCVAKVSGAKYRDIAYCSFEGAFKPLGATDAAKGNWDFNTARIQLASTTAASVAMTGKYIYELPVSAPWLQQGGNVIESKFATSAGTKYILTCWATGNPDIQLGNTSLLVSNVRQVGNWHLYSVTFAGNGSNLLIRNPGTSTIHLDELRLYPAGSSISTTTYEPLLGVSSQCDNQSNIIHYEYDDFGRLIATRDIDGNVLSVTRSYNQKADN